MSKHTNAIPGVDTIEGLVGNPPMKVELPKKTVETLDAVRAELNALYIAVIPYCFKCKEPLAWHVPLDDKLLFHCPICGREWRVGINGD